MFSSLFKSCNDHNMNLTVVLIKDSVENDVSCPTRRRRCQHVELNVARLSIDVQDRSSLRQSGDSWPSAS